MKRYTMGALFTPDLSQILLIRKSRPEWQKGKLNFPGGHIEEGETPKECVAREFLEETGVDIPFWSHIGQIENEGNYTVDFFTAIYLPGMDPVKFDGEEAVMWCSTDPVTRGVISNLHWLIPFAMNFHLPGNNPDLIQFGHFKYKY